jgi:hypothetical protein
VGENLASHGQNLNRARRTFDTYTFAVRSLNALGKRFRTVIPRWSQIPSAACAACRMSVDDMSVDGTRLVSAQLHRHVGYTAHTKLTGRPDIGPKLA